MCRTQVEILPFWRDLVGLAIALTAVAAVAADGTVVLWESLSFLGLCPQPTRACPSSLPACTPPAPRLQPDLPCALSRASARCRSLTRRCRAADALYVLHQRRESDKSEEYEAQLTEYENEQAREEAEEGE